MSKLNRQTEYIDNNLWNGQQRAMNLNCRVEEINAFFDSVNLEKFILTLSFLVKLFQNSEVQQQSKIIKDNFNSELNIYGKDVIGFFLQKKAFDRQQEIKDQNILLRLIEYVVDSFSIVLLNENKIFLNLIFKNIKGTHYYMKSGQEDIDLKIMDFEFINPSILNKSNQLVFGCLKDKKKYMQNDTPYNFVISISSFNAYGKMHQNKWKIFSSIEIQLHPVIVNFSNETFVGLYDFIWNTKSNSINPKNSKEKSLEEELNEIFFTDPDKFEDKKKELLRKSNKFKNKINSKEGDSLIPSYFQNIRFCQLSICLNYNTSNPLLVK